MVGDVLMAADPSPHTSLPPAATSCRASHVELHFEWCVASRCTQAHAHEKAGGFSHVKDATDEVRALFETDDVRLAVGAQLGYDVHALRVTSYTSQVVSGARRRPRGWSRDGTLGSPAWPC